MHAHTHQASCCCVHLTGTQSQETVYLLNDESIPYHFAFTEQSCQFDGHSSQILVEPMAGTIQPKTKYHTVFDAPHPDVFTCGFLF